MHIGDLVFLASVLLLLILIVRAAVQMARGRWRSAGRTGSLLSIFLVLYASVLFGVALSMPRRFFAPGQEECFDDWCVAAVSAEAAGSHVCASGDSGSVWMATLRVSSQAKRIRQRARDASAVMEDLRGNRYEQCANASRALSDELGPGDSFDVQFPFLLPIGVHPEGVVVRHGAFPSVAIIGDYQSFLHPPSLLQFPHR